MKSKIFLSTHEMRELTRWPETTEKHEDAMITVKNTYHYIQNKYPEHLGVAFTEQDMLSLADFAKDFELTDALQILTIWRKNHNK